MSAGRFVIACCALSLRVMALAAQDAPGDIGVQGTAAYNRVWNGVATQPNALIPTGWRSSGRVGVRVASRWYAGLSVGSWEYAIGSTSAATGDVIPDRYGVFATSVVMSTYGQFYPVRRLGVFLRGGAGYAINRTYDPGVSLVDGHDTVSYLVRTSAKHLSATGGIGVDLPLRPHLAISLSADYTRLVGAETGREATSALLAGFGLTLR